MIGPHTRPTVEMLAADLTRLVKESCTAPEDLPTEPAHAVPLPDDSVPLKEGKAMTPTLRRYRILTPHRTEEHPVRIEVGHDGTARAVFSEVGADYPSLDELLADLGLERTCLGDEPS